MRAGFVLTAGDPGGYVSADVLCGAIRRYLPDVPVIQFTDPDSPAVVGVDEVRRQPAQPFARFIAEQFATCEGEWLLLDTDVVLQENVASVFDQPFELALASRDGTYLEGEAESDFMRAMPFNAGVLFARGPDPLQAIRDRVAELSDQEQSWLGFQRAVCERILSGGSIVRILPSRYNYPPKSADDDVTPHALVHYKGPWRKTLLRARCWRELTCASA